MKYVSTLFAVGVIALSACRIKATYPASRLAISLRNICAKEYKLDIETRQTERSLQAHVWKIGLFRGDTEDLQGMSRESMKSLQDVLLSATRIALSTDADLDFIEIRVADVLTGASMTIWRYVPDIKDSMAQRYGEMEYFSRLVVDVKPGDKVTKAADKKLLLGQIRWEQPISLAEFLAKQVLMRARREGAERLLAHVDLSEPSTLGVVIENWAALKEDEPEEAVKMTDAVHRSAQKVIQGYGFNGFRNLVVRDGRGTALQRWAF